MSNPIRNALAIARAWILESGLSERALATRTGLAARSIGYFKEPGRDPRVSTLAKVLDAMDADDSQDGTIPDAQGGAQGHDKANKSHCDTRAAGEAA